jgi:hypothetical protein
VTHRTPRARRHIRDRRRHLQRDRRRRHPTARPGLRSEAPRRLVSDLIREQCVHAAGDSKPRVAPDGIVRALARGRVFLFRLCRSSLNHISYATTVRSAPGLISPLFSPPRPHLPNPPSQLSIAARAVSHSGA